MKYPKGTETLAVTIRFSKKQIDGIKKTARHMAIKEERDITYQDLIREAIEKVYFSGKKKK